MGEDIMPKFNVPVLDSYLTGYTVEQGRETLYRLGPSGRDVYKSMYELGYDIVVPISLTILQVALISKTYPLPNQPNTILFNFIPILYMIFDYSENFIIYNCLKL
eukprot:gene1225-1548_t